MIVVNVPVSEADELRRVIGEAGGGKMGEYSYCSFSVTGTGWFLPNENANPTIGKSGQLESVAEERIEISCDQADATTIVRTIRAAHSYEEPAIFVYPLLSVDE